MSDYSSGGATASSSTGSWMARDILRIIAGLLMMQHGAAKLFGVLGGMGGPGVTAPLGSLMGAAATIELVGGFLVAIGFLTRPVAFIVAGEMAVAYFKVHAPNGFWPILNMGELAVIYCFVFLSFAVSGAGPWSVDGLMRRSRMRG